MKQPNAPASEQGRWKNIALTVYLIAPLAIVAGLCVWIMISLQNRVENAGRTRGLPTQTQSPTPGTSEEDNNAGG